MCPKPFSWEKNKRKLFFRREVERSALSESGTYALYSNLAFYSLFLSDCITFSRFVKYSLLDSDIES